MKLCKGCGETKPLDAFNRNKASKDGLARLCRNCANAYARSYHQRDPRKYAATRQAWEDANRETRKAYQRDWKRQWREGNPEREAEITARFRESNPDYYRKRYWSDVEKNRARAREQMRRHREQNPDSDKEAYRRYRAKHADEIKRKQREAADARRAERETRTTKRCCKCGETKPLGDFPPRNDSPIGVRSTCWSCTRENARSATARWREANPAASRDAVLRWITQTKDASPETIAYMAILMDDPCSYCNCAAEHIDHIEPRDLRGVHDWPNLTGACRSCNPSKGSRPLLLWLAKRRPTP